MAKRTNDWMDRHAGPDFGFFLCTWQGPPRWQFPCLYSSVVEFRYPWGQSSLNHPGRHGICACSVVAGCFVPPVGPAGGSRELARWVKRLPGYLLRSPWSVQVPLLGAFEGLSTLRGPHVKPPPGPPVRCRPTGQVQYAPICGVLWALYKTPTARLACNIRAADMAMVQGDTAPKVA